MLIAPSLFLFGEFLLYQVFDERFQHALREHLLQLRSDPLEQFLHECINLVRIRHTGFLRARMEGGGRGQERDIGKDSRIGRRDRRYSLARFTGPSFLRGFGFGTQGSILLRGLFHMRIC